MIKAIHRQLNVTLSYPPLPSIFIMTWSVEFGVLRIVYFLV